MITINEETLKELILRTEPDFLAQKELEVNGFGKAHKFLPEDNEFIWVWDKARIRNLNELDLHYIVTKIVE